MSTMATAPAATSSPTTTTTEIRALADALKKAPATIVEDTNFRTKSLPVIGSASRFELESSIPVLVGGLVGYLESLPSEGTNVEGFKNAVSVGSAIMVALSDASYKPDIKHMRSEGLPKLAAFIKTAIDTANRADAIRETGLEPKLNEQFGALALNTYNNGKLDSGPC